MDSETLLTLSEHLWCLHRTMSWERQTGFYDNVFPLPIAFRHNVCAKIIAKINPDAGYKATVCLCPVRVQVHPATYERQKRTLETYWCVQTSLCYGRFCTQGLKPQCDSEPPRPSLYCREHQRLLPNLSTARLEPQNRCELLNSCVGGHCCKTPPPLDGGKM